VRASASESEETTKLDCGVNALFVLFRLEGRPVTLDLLESALPRRHPDGYSMAQLAAAARSLGLVLDGVRLAKLDKPLTRPAIAFLKDGKAGHFAVLRPVGTTGTMVQVIDPPSAPWIADYDRLLSAKAWTGRVLVVREASTIRNALPLLSLVTALILLVAGLSYRLLFTDRRQLNKLARGRADITGP
jgi:ABC-type bacteriocin/lantibiotic exporter with double-glycine peptidase domain